MEASIDPNLGLGIYSFNLVVIQTHAFSFRIKVHFKDSKGSLLKTVEANEGDDILSIAHEYDIDLEGTCLKLPLVYPLLILNVQIFSPPRIFSNLTNDIQAHVRARWPVLPVM